MYKSTDRVDGCCVAENNDRDRNASQHRSRHRSDFTVSDAVDGNDNHVDGIRPGPADESISNDRQDNDAQGDTEADHHAKHGSHRAADGGPASREDSSDSVASLG